MNLRTSIDTVQVVPDLCAIGETERFVNRLFTNQNPWFVLLNTIKLHEFVRIGESFESTGIVSGHSSVQILDTIEIVLLDCRITEILFDGSQTVPDNRSLVGQIEYTTITSGFISSFTRLIP
jgi:hypothetical protein